MDLELIIATIMAAAPALTSIIGIIISVVKMIKEGKTNNKELITKFEEVREEVMKTKEYEELKAQVVEVHKENIELKKLLKEYLTKIDKVAREE